LILTGIFDILDIWNLFSSLSSRVYAIHRTTDDRQG